MKILVTLTILTLTNTAHSMWMSKPSQHSNHESPASKQRYIDPRLRNSSTFNDETHIIAVIAIPTKKDHALGEAHNTVALDLSRNALNHLVLPFDYPNLKELDCSQNELTEIPEGVCKSSKLENLYMSHNQITKIPGIITGLRALRVLDLSYNGIKDLREELSSLITLKVLNVAHNRITFVPKRFKNLRYLELLNISGNPFTVTEILNTQNTLTQCHIQTADPLK